mmetsp:Transcript_12776/g.34181  ORF Transcript_12776/g.34181 Transcript_12776/m.34181 type:complete len:182 (+) Transcript_12776:136-681(+)
MNFPLILCIALGAPVPADDTIAATTSHQEINEEIVTLDLSWAAPASLGARKELETPPEWPGSVSCAPRGSQEMTFQAFSTVPAGLPEDEVAPGAVENTCTMICLPKNLKNIAAKHGVHYGSTCFGTNDGSLYPFDAQGNDIDGRQICPGATFLREGKNTGIQFFTYTCAEGNVINYGGKHK